MSTSIEEQYTSVCERLANYLAAEEAILGGAQSYSIGNRSLTRGDLKSIHDMIDLLNGRKLKLERGNKIKVQRVVPRDI